MHGPGDVRVDDVSEPEAGPHDVIVRVTSCGICGTDLRYVRLGGLAGPMGHPRRWHGKGILQQTPLVQRFELCRCLAVSRQ